MNLAHALSETTELLHLRARPVTRSNPVSLASFLPRGGGDGIRRAENRLSVAALLIMSVLPLVSVATRRLGLRDLPGSSVFVEHLTLWMALLGGALAARSDRLLSLATGGFLPEGWRPAARIFSAAVAAAIEGALAAASFQLVLVERQAGSALALGIPVWMVLLIMPAGFALIAARTVWNASPAWRGRAVAALGLLAPVALVAAPFLKSAPVVPIGLALLLAATAVGLPIFAVLAGVALFLFWSGSVPIAAAPVEFYRLVASPLLPSIPLFTLAGYVLAEGGASRRLLRVFLALFGWLPGGLAIVTAMVFGFFTITGSGVAILSLGGLMLPVLLRAKYPEDFSIGLLTASGSLGLLFPPSLPVILYGVYAQIPIDRLFIGAFVPGLLMVALASGWGVRQGLRSGGGRAAFSWGEARKALWDARWELLTPVVVLIGLFGGFATLVETAAISVLYAFLVEFLLYRDLSLRRDLGRVAVECATVVGGVLVILGAAMAFTNYLVHIEAPTMLVTWVQAHVHSKLVFLLLLNVLLLAAGALIDIFAAIIVLVPLITPLGAAFAVDPVQLGIIFLANMELGCLAPPFGMNLFLSAYRFERPLSQVSRAALPFLLILLAGVVIITYVPQITTAPLAWLGK